MTVLRRDALMHNWNAARTDNPLERIGGLMVIEVIGIRRLGGFKLELEFSDGAVGARDFEPLIQRTGPMVALLIDPK